MLSKWFSRRVRSGIRAVAPAAAVLGLLAATQAVAHAGYWMIAIAGTPSGTYMGGPYTPPAPQNNSIQTSYNCGFNGAGNVKLDLTITIYWVPNFGNMQNDPPLSQNFYEGGSAGAIVMTQPNGGAIISPVVSFALPGTPIVRGGNPAQGVYTGSQSVSWPNVPITHIAAGTPSLVLHRSLSVSAQAVSASGGGGPLNLSYNIAAVP